MHIYDEIWDSTSLSIRIASGHDGSLIVDPSRSEYDEIIPLGTCLVIDSVFGVCYYKYHVFLDFLPYYVLLLYQNMI